MISSFNPLTNNIINAAPMYFAPRILVKSPNNKMAKVNEIKMAMPPKRGIFKVWIFRSSGLSYKFFNLATVIIDGIAKIDAKNAVAVAKISVII